MRSGYTKEHLAFFRLHYPKMSVVELTAAFNAKFDLDKSAIAIKSQVKANGIKCGRKKGNKTGSKLFTLEQIDWITEHYKYLVLPHLSQAFNYFFKPERTQAQIKTYIHNNGVLSGRTGCFEKGHVNWNAGTKGLTSANKNSFKPGEKPKNSKPLGHERIDKRDGTILIKVAEPNPYTPAKTRYKAKAVVVWEKHNGPKPKGHAITFRDNNNQNCEYENLMLLTKRELLQINRNGHGKVEPELKDTVKALADLQIKQFELR